jgi:HlyD family secretion protein
MDISRPELALARRRKRNIAIVIGALIFAAAAFGIYRMEPAAPTLAKSAAWIDTVKRGSLTIEVRGPGVLVPKSIRWLSAETAARVERIVVKPGALVQADTVIVELSNPEVQDALLAARAAVTAARADLSAQQTQLNSQLLDQRANVAQVQADLESANLQAEAEADLVKKGVIPAITYKRTELNRDQLKLKLQIERERMQNFARTIDAQLSASGARLAQLDNTLKLRMRQADALMVKAGIAGILQQVPLQEGQQVQAGLNLARVAEPGQLMAELKVPETQAKDITIGLKVRVDTRNGVVDGSVTRIDPAVLAGTVQVDVDLTGALPEGARPDLSVDGVIEIAKLDDVLYLGRPSKGDPRSQIALFKLRADDQSSADRVTVTLGRASVNVIEVTAGLSVGDRVLLSDTSEFDRFQRIRIK